MELEDRISQLPQHILQNHILSLLPQNDAVRTCTLSKTWRHLGLTRPKFEYDEFYFPEEKQQFLPFLENTLQRYDDQNLSIQEFFLAMKRAPDPESESESISFLNKWIPKIITNMGVKTFNLWAHDFTLPPVVFQSGCLTELDLTGCKLDQIQINVKLQLLKRLSLSYLCIDEETFEKIMSSCPLIEHLVLVSCFGLSTVKVNKVPNLKHFDCHIEFFFREDDKRIGSIEMNDAPSLETIHIYECHNWLYHHLHDNFFFFPRLKSLYLLIVHLPKELLNNLSSNNCPCLEGLELHNCTGITEFKLSNRSIERLVINVTYPLIKVDIDAANMLYFEYRNVYLSSISFATTSREWESHIHVGDFFPGPNAWYLKLHEILKAVSQSQISLYISRLPMTNQDSTFGGICEPVVVEHLCFSAYDSSYHLPTLFNYLFRICRPIYIRLSLSATISGRKTEERQLAESIRKTLVKKKGGTRQCYFWQQELEESIIQVSDENSNEWHPVHICEFTNNQSIHLMLKWRER